MKIPKVRMTVEIRFRHDGYELMRDVVRVNVVPILKEFVMVLPRENLQKMTICLNNTSDLLFPHTLSLSREKSSATAYVVPVEK